MSNDLDAEFLVSKLLTRGRSHLVLDLLGMASYRPELPVSGATLIRAFEQFLSEEAWEREARPDLDDLNRLHERLVDLVTDRYEKVAELEWRLMLTLDT